jgi:hypothetical protein
MDAMLVFAELGRVLAAVPLLGHLPATFLLDAGARLRRLEALAPASSGGVRRRQAADRRRGRRGRPIRRRPRRRRRRLGDGRCTGEVGWVPDAPGATLLVGRRRGRPRAGCQAVARRSRSRRSRRYDATRSLGHVPLSGPRPCSTSPDSLARGRVVPRAGAARPPSRSARSSARSRSSVAYAKERFTFGRAIGSYQAVKHELVEVLRGSENAPLAHVLRRAGPAATAGGVPARRRRAFRRAGGGRSTRRAAQISVHGGIGATWEHDAPLYFRRAQLSRRLLRRRRPTGADACAAGAAAAARACRRYLRRCGSGPTTAGASPCRTHHRFPIDKYRLLRERVAGDGPGVLEAEPGPRGR